MWPGALATQLRKNCIHSVPPKVLRTVHVRLSAKAWECCNKTSVWAWDRLLASSSPWTAYVSVGMFVCLLLPCLISPHLNVVLIACVFSLLTLKENRDWGSQSEQRSMSVGLLVLHYPSGYIPLLPAPAGRRLYHLQPGLVEGISMMVYVLGPGGRQQEMRTWIICWYNAYRLFAYCWCCSSTPLSIYCNRKLATHSVRWRQSGPTPQPPQSSPRFALWQMGFEETSRKRPPNLQKPVNPLFLGTSRNLPRKIVGVGVGVGVRIWWSWRHVELSAWALSLLLWAVLWSVEAIRATPERSIWK